MLYHHLKENFRLNRTIGLSFLFYGLLYATLLNQEYWAPTMLLGAWMLLSAVFLAANEIALQVLKKSAAADNETHESQTLEKFSVLVPTLMFGITAAGYILSGQFIVYLFSLLPAFQSQLFGHSRLAKILFVAASGLFLAGLVGGYPKVPGVTGLTGFLMLMPLIIALLQFSNNVGHLVRSTSHQMTRLQSLAATDGLTGLINRRQFNHQLLSEISRARRHGAPLSLALFDIDDFKKLNDFYGHPVGDRVLRELGSLISKNVRDCDIPARYGGEEFALILPETSQADAYELLERLRALVERTVFCLPDNPLTTSISVGIAELDVDAHTHFDLVEQADAALYEAKNRGKNQVVFGVLPTPKISVQPHQRYLR